MLDLDQLEEEREESLEEKAELFEFYHANWGKLVAELRAYQQGAAIKDKWIDKQLAK